MHQIRWFSARFGGKIIGFDEILTGSWLDWARSRWFLLFFCVFCQVSAEAETDATCGQTDLRNPTLLRGQLWVENLPTWSLTGWLRVGHKPDPPDPWTPLLTIISCFRHISISLISFQLFLSIFLVFLDTTYFVEIENFLLKVL